MKARITNKVYIDAKSSEIFKYLADLQYHRLWNPTLQSVVPEVPLAEGVEYRSYNWLFNMKIMGKVRVEKFLPPHRLDIRSIAGMLEYQVSYRLVEQQIGTQVECRVAVSTKSKAFGFAKPMMHLLARHEMQTDLQALKQLVEQGTSVK